MKPNQVQLWRIVNGAARSFVQFGSFPQRGRDRATVAWRQIAQDGVQFAYPNYQRIGTVNGQFNLAAANRADLLVRAPAQEADYALTVVASVSDVPNNPNQGAPVTLLTVRVKADDKKIDPPMDFIATEQDFPRLPSFLADITGPVNKKRELHFNTVPKSGRGGGKMPLHEIDGKLFNGHEVDQTMILNSTEEWTMYNQTVNIAHPFHIHINPFQITEVFQPNSKDASTKGGPCYADPLKPATWKQCTKITGPFVWWDVFAIPTARADTLPTTVCTQVDKCPADIQEYTTCSGGTCTVTIPGFFRMKSRFVDFTGQYVLHCHILAHEDRGMMQLVEVVPKGASQYEHH
jgi:FtsP/CotA-like multicopper oxidase with cupredoxin domain